MSKAQVGVLMGSDSDWDVMSDCCKMLEELGLTWDVNVISAHRTPDAAAAYAQSAAERGMQVLIAGAGCAAHLAGALAANTHLPVIGVPLDPAGTGGMDALLATVQMPAGIPVATVAVGRGGARNAAILAAQIIALAEEKVRKALLAYRAAMPEKVAGRNEKVRAEAERIRKAGA